MGAQWQQGASGSQPGAPGPSHHYDPLSEMQGVHGRRRRRWLGLELAPNEGFFRTLCGNLWTNMRKVKEEISKTGATLIARLPSSHNASDARQKPTAIVPSDSADRFTDTGFTGICDREASSCDRISQRDDPHSCLSAIDGSSSAASLPSLGRGSAGPSVASHAADGARNIGPIVDHDQSPADCRRKIEECKAETTSSEQKDSKGNYTSKR